MGLQPQGHTIFVLIKKSQRCFATLSARVKSKLFLRLCQLVSPSLPAGRVSDDGAERRAGAPTGTSRRRHLGVRRELRAEHARTRPVPPLPLLQPPLPSSQVRDASSPVWFTAEGVSVLSREGADQVRWMQSLEDGVVP